SPREAGGGAGAIPRGPRGRPPPGSAASVCGPGRWTSGTAPPPIDCTIAASSSGAGTAGRSRRSFRRRSRTSMNTTFARASALLVLAILLCAFTAEAAVGVTEIPGQDGDGPVTIYYPSSSEAQPLRRGPFTLQMAWQGTPVRGNGRLVVISHGSGGSPWVHADLARVLVEEGFVVAMPEHRGDNFKDHSMVGPESWKRRPAEVSRAIDPVGADARFKPLLALDKVGMYGMSAGGHTALVLAGGRWSPARFAAHCETHIAEDFQGCVGLTTRLTG